MTQHEHLDFLLKSISKASQAYPLWLVSSILRPLNVQYNYHDLVTNTRKLENDGFIERWPGNGDVQVRITPDGIDFINKGGYVEHNKITIEENRKAEEKEKLEIRGLRWGIRGVQWNLIFALINIVVGALNVWLLFNTNTLNQKGEAKTQVITDHIVQTKSAPIPLDTMSNPIKLVIKADTSKKY